MSIAAILLAAHSIDGHEHNPGLLPWRADQTLIEYQVDQLERVLREASPAAWVIEVVVGLDAEEVIPIVAGDNVEPIIDPTWMSDPSSALRVGAAAVPRGTTSVLIVPVTAPRPASIYRTVIEAHATSGARITRPSFEGTPGYPIVVDENVLAALRNVSDERGGIDALLQQHTENAHDVPLESAVALLSIRSLSDYVEARASFAFDVTRG
ncbi:MAG TPA: NTP transferase domain-containing protein [Dehalococcoidia bacterium]|jgi:CTP:molybdopterin cytidylyltransferase MocA